MCMRYLYFCDKDEVHHPECYPLIAYLETYDILAHLSYAQDEL